MFLRILKRQERGTQKRRMLQVRMVIGKGTEFDHDRFVTRGER